MKNLRAQPGGHEPTPRERFDEYRRRAFDIAQLLTLGQPVPATFATIADATGMSQSQAHEMKDLLVTVAAIDWRRGLGGVGTWTLKMPTDQMFNALEMEMERQMRGGLTPSQLARKRRVSGVTRQSAERVAVIEDRIGLPVGAVVGPEAPNVLQPLKGLGPDGPGALVMAAKQYRGGVTEATRKAAQMVEDLSAMGVPVPAELRERAKPRTDDRLEAIRLVLPYIEALERRLVATEDQVKQMADYGSLKQTVDRQRTQIERMVADRTAASMREQAKTN